MTAAKARACWSTRKAVAPGGRGDGADAKLVSEQEDRCGRAQSGATSLGETRSSCPPRGATEQAREGNARAVSERPKGLQCGTGARRCCGADGRGRHVGGEQQAQRSESGPEARSQRITFELTPTAEAGAVSRDGDDSTTGAGPAYSACRSGSGVERVVRRHWRRLRMQSRSL